MPPCISKDREDLVAAAGSRLIQVRSYGHRAMHTDQRPQAWHSRITTSCTYLLPHVLLRGCVARICGETCMISPEVQQDLYGYIGTAFGVRGEVGISQLRSAEMHAPTQLCLFHVWCLCGCALLWVVLERSSVSGLRPLLPSRSPVGDLRSDP